MGVVAYDTPEGGSGFIANSSLPWLSSFNITQQAPVYDQDMAWLRNQRPGSYTNYSRFGDPYSLDGGVLPPYADDGLAGLGDTTDVLLRSDVVAPMPSITSTSREGCIPVSNVPTVDTPIWLEPGPPAGVDVSDSGIDSTIQTVEATTQDWVEQHPWLALLIAVAAGALLFGGDGSKKR